MTVPLLEGARGFAVSMQPKDGLFNLGEAQGLAAFLAFCSTLHLPRKGTTYPLRSLMPEIEILQEKANTAFQPPRSIDLHTLFMSLNSALKQARELDATKHYSGALYQYLYALGYYGRHIPSCQAWADFVVYCESLSYVQLRYAFLSRRDHEPHPASRSAGR